jgi:spermidine synthase
LPKTACGFNDSRVELHFADGLKYVRHAPRQYDLIIVDSTDPSGPGEVLFTREFYGSCHHALTDQGILVNQHESPFYATDAQAMQSAHKRIRSVFPVSRVYQAHIPTYPSGHWLFGFASKGIRPVEDLDAERWNGLNLPTRYYNTSLHRGAFCLPNYVEELLKRDE